MQNKILLSLVSVVALMAMTTYFNYGFISYEPADAELADLECGFTNHFSNFLKNKGYDSWGFDRSDLKCAAFGGKANVNDTIVKRPVIFIHGNSDLAFGRGSADGYVSWQTGFRSLATYLSTQGYKKSEMYTTTWGPADPNQAQQNWHKKEWIMRMRAFV